MSNLNINTHSSSISTSLDNHSHDSEVISLLGFWIYLMTDCIIFASIFSVYAVLMHNVAGGPSAHDIFNLPYVLIETFLLLVSSITYGFAMLNMYKGNKKEVFIYLALTFFCGIGFISMEVNEFALLIHEGFTPSKSGFLSAFFTLVGTHGLHVASGLIWMLIIMYQIQKKGINQAIRIRMGCLSLFWHFLDVIWICVFSIVYLMGVI